MVDCQGKSTLQVIHHTAMQSLSIQPTVLCHYSGLNIVNVHYEIQKKMFKRNYRSRAPHFLNST